MPQPAARTTFFSFSAARRGILWLMVAALALGGLLGAALLLGGVGDTTAWRVESTLFALALHCAASLSYLRRGTTNFSWPLTVVLGVCILNFLILAGATWITRDEDEAWMQTLVLIGVAGLSTPASILLRKRIESVIANSSVIATICAGGLSLYMIWTDSLWSYRPTMEKATGIAWVWAIAGAMICALFALRVPARLRALRIGVIPMVMIGASLVTAGVVNNQFWDEDFFRRLTLVFCILSVCGVTINAVLARLYRQPPAFTGDRTSINLELRCPKCREELLQPSGSSGCPHCATRFEIRVLPSQCLTCGYDLRGLPEPNCPECGARY